MEKYANFRAADFLVDTNFINWISGRKSPSSAWIKWVITNMDKMPELKKAVLIYRSLNYTNHLPDDDAIDEEWYKFTRQNL